MAERSFYKKYMSSYQWKEKRLEKIKLVKWKCERCGKSYQYRSRHLQCHHKTYKRLGCELMEDLEILCCVCHGLEHGLYFKNVDGKWVKERVGPPLPEHLKKKV
jgi:hypothetical protein